LIEFSSEKFAHKLLLLLVMPFSALILSLEAYSAFSMSVIAFFQFQKFCMIFSMIFSAYFYIFCLGSFSHLSLLKSLNSAFFQGQWDALSYLFAYFETFCWIMDILNTLIWWFGSYIFPPVHRLFSLLAISWSSLFIPMPGAK
jgi:hypothetical protein